VRLNIGSGNRNLQAGYTTLDANPAMAPDIVARVPPIPVPDGSCEAVYCSHLIEHLSNEEASELIREVWRVLQPGAEAVFIAPHAGSAGAFADPTHRSYWVPERWQYYTPAMRYLGYGLESRFELLRAFVEGQDVVAVLRKVSRCE
jgi:predicted SAM-dependent methyltransferase